MKIKEKIILLMPTEKDNAITTKQLQNLTGLSNKQLKVIISNLREDYPICSKTTDGGGYWIAQNMSEIVDFVREISSRRRSHTKTIKDMGNHCKNIRRN